MEDAASIVFSFLREKHNLIYMFASLALLDHRSNICSYLTHSNRSLVGHCSTIIVSMQHRVELVACEQLPCAGHSAETRSEGISGFWSHTGHSWQRIVSEGIWPTTCTLDLDGTRCGDMRRGNPLHDGHCSSHYPPRIP